MRLAGPSNSGDAAVLCAAALAVTPARADEFDRMIAAFDGAMIAKFATSEEDSRRLFDIGKRAASKISNGEPTCTSTCPREQAIYFSLGLWWAARAQSATIDAMKRGQGEFGEGFKLNSSDGVADERAISASQLRRRGRRRTTRAAGDLISGPAVARLPRPKP